MLRADRKGADECPFIASNLGGVSHLDFAPPSANFPDSSFVYLISSCFRFVSFWGCWGEGGGVCLFCFALLVGVWVLFWVVVFFVFFFSFCLSCFLSFLFSFFFLGEEGGRCYLFACCVVAYSPSSMLIYPRDRSALANWRAATLRKAAGQTLLSRPVTKY